jgi:ribosomal protein S27E
MATADRIQCPNCQRAVVPQLWVDDRNRLEYPKVIHLCPFCGIALKESGGGIDRRMLAFIIGIISLCILLFGLFIMNSRFS